MQRGPLIASLLLHSAIMLVALLFGRGPAVPARRVTVHHVLGAQPAPPPPCAEPLFEITVEAMPADELVEPVLPVAAPEPEPGPWPMEPPVPPRRLVNAVLRPAAPLTIPPVPCVEPVGTSAKPEPNRSENQPPHYPPRARDIGQQGTVVLLVEVDARGRVTHCRVLHSSGYPLLDLAALQAVKEWSFTGPAGNVEVLVEFLLATELRTSPHGLSQPLSRGGG